MLIHAHLHTIAHTPIEGSPTDSEEEAGDHMILNQPTQWSTILGDQILVVRGDWGPEEERGGEGRSRKSEGGEGRCGEEQTDGARMVMQIFIHGPLLSVTIPNSTKQGHNGPL